MTLAQILKEKKEISNNLKTKYKLPKKNKALWLIKLTNKTLLQKLYFWLANLPIDFVVIWDFWKVGIDEQFKNIYVDKEIKNEYLKWFDFCVFDSEITDLTKYSENAITPILPENNHLSAIVKEYQPMKNEWNWYLYKDVNEWSIFHAIARYLENYKISFDNKNLVKNVWGG